MNRRPEVVNDVEETTDVVRVACYVRSPCEPCRCSGSVVFLLDGRVETRICLWCKGSGFRRIKLTAGGKQ